MALTESSPTNPDGSKSFSSGRAANDDKTPITVYDPTYFSPETTQTQDGHTAPNEVATELPTEETRYRPATTQERFAAFFTDTLLFAPIAFGMLALMKRLLPQVTAPHLLGLAVLFLYLLYYLITETIFAASPGKILTGLRIRKLEGGPPSLLEAVIRNLMRLIDYPLFFIAVGGAMEGTKRLQRLGDLAARTMVVRDIAVEPHRLPPDSTALAGATRRTLAWLFDLALFAVPFVYGLWLLLPAEPTWLTAIAVPAVPLAMLLLLTLCETFFQSTPGKVLCGMKVAQEDGRPARFATLWLRNAFKLFDANPIGYLCIFLSTRNQRPGDIAAGTLVFRDRHGVKAWLSFLILIPLAVVPALLGLKNPNSFLKRNASLTIGNFLFDPVPNAVKRMPFLHLGIRIEDLKLGLTDQEENPSKLFSPGQPIYLHFRLSGYSMQSEKAWVQADLKVRDPHGTLVLDKMNVINSSLPVGKRTTARLITRFALNPQAEAGTYQASLKIRDMFGGRSVERTETFFVQP